MLSFSADAIEIVLCTSNTGHWNCVDHVGGEAYRSTAITFIEIPTTQKREKWSEDTSCTTTAMLSSGPIVVCVAVTCDAHQGAGYSVGYA